ncbi:unnamed protein product [Urochloa decumbens]|uniref:Uncharacterized protein n=1 Tax=Urochloa decumbens TaxID=240449 RepID=A0ABC8ZTF6_9POAL
MKMVEKKDEFSAEKVIAEFEQLSRDSAAVQRETLRRILASNAAAEYLQGLGLAGRTDPDSFRACVPLATHAEFEPYIARIADGDTSAVLTATPVTSISLSSGTTQGKRNNDCHHKLVQFNKEEFRTKMRSIQLDSCSPPEVVFCPDFSESLYCLLFSGEVRTVSATFAHSVVPAFETFEHVWEDLCADIRRGAPSPAGVTDPAVRRAVSALLAAPNAALADEVARKCGELISDDWHGVIPALWPNAKYVNTIVTGSMEHYVKKLRHYAGGLPLVDRHGLRRVGRDDWCQRLFRYRLGDVVKVDGFYNYTPKLKIIGRRNLTLSINVDKNTEKDVQLAVDGATKILAAEGLEVMDYTSYADLSTNPGHCIVFWELNDDKFSDGKLQSCCNELDRGFVDAGYLGSRQTRAIRPLQLRVLRRGTFEKVMHHYLSLGAPVNQFKLPRCMPRSNSGILQILSGNALKVFISTAYD